MFLWGGDGQSFRQVREGHMGLENSMSNVPVARILGRERGKTDSGDSAALRSIHLLTSVSVG